MNRIRKAGILLVTLLCLGLVWLELSHLQHYGHLVPLGLHADVDITMSNDVLEVEGTAKIYDAKLTNFGIFPATIVVCDLLVSNMPGTDLNYVVERWDSQSGIWRFVPEWDFYGSRLFCRPAFEVSEERLARRRLWPGQSIEVGEGVPGQMGGFHIGDDGRFTIFLNGDGDRRSAISTAIFRVDQQAKKSHASSPD